MSGRNAKKAMDEFDKLPDEVQAFIVLAVLIGLGIAIFFPELF